MNHFKNTKASGSQEGADPHHSLHELVRHGRVSSAFLICGALTLLSHRNHLFNPYASGSPQPDAYSSLSHSLFAVTVQPSDLVTISPPPPVFLFCLCSLTITIKDLITIPLRARHSLPLTPFSFWLFILVCSSHLYQEVKAGLLCRAQKHLCYTLNTQKEKKNL